MLKSKEKAHSPGEGQTAQGLSSGRLEQHTDGVGGCSPTENTRASPELLRGRSLVKARVLVSCQTRAF